MPDQECFVLTVDESTVTLFVLGIGVQVRDLVEEDDIPEPGSWYTILEDDYIPSPETPISNFKTSNKDGVCHIQLFASKPYLTALPPYMRKKFRGAVWSPYVQYLNDKNGVLKEVMGGEVVEVIVKYAPFENKLFEVVSFVDWKDEPEEASLSVYQNTPWYMEYLAREMRPCHEVLPDKYGCINQMQIYTHEQVAVGVCIVYKAPNPTHGQFARNRKVSDGSEQFVSWLWSPIFGLTRWMIRPDVQRSATDRKGDEEKEEETYDDADGNRLSALGKWFAYRLNDPRWKEKKKGATIGEQYNVTRTTMAMAASTDIKITGVEKPFVVVPKEQWQRNQPYDTHELQMEVSFPFKRMDIENENGRVKQDAHFFDLQLGKVEIYPIQGELILKKVDSHLKELQEKSIEEFEKANDEVFIVVATVTVCRTFYENARTYPKHGLFLVKWIDQIKYLHGGRSIYQKE